MQIQRVETSAGIAICCAPSRIACRVSLPSSRLRFHILNLDGSVIDQNADGERQTAPAS